jgi:ATP-dependent Clp protease ATP-binding subunit ClpA
MEAVVAKMARVPVQSVSSDDKKALASLDVELRRVIYGQDAAIGEVASAIKLARSGLRSADKPIGNFLFAGPTGVGKTELARQLARILGVEFLRYDMSEYMEKHAVSRLIGAPPGYVGYEEGGLLIDAVRKSPHAVLAARRDREGASGHVQHPAAGHGSRHADRFTRRKADFRHVILIMTTNAGARDVSDRRLGFARRARAAPRAARSSAPSRRSSATGSTPRHLQRARRARGRARGRQADRRAARDGCGQGHHHRARAGGARVAGRKGFDRAFGAAPMARLIERVIKKPLVGAAAVRLAGDGARCAWWSTAASCGCSPSGADAGPAGA